MTSILGFLLATSLAFAPNGQATGKVHDLDSDQQGSCQIILIAAANHEFIGRVIDEDMVAILAASMKLDDQVTVQYNGRNDVSAVEWKGHPSPASRDSYVVAGLSVGDHGPCHADLDNANGMIHVTTDNPRLKKILEAGMHDGWRLTYVEFDSSHVLTRAKINLDDQHEMMRSAKAAHRITRGSSKKK